jgi:hypothetical protein
VKSLAIVDGALYAAGVNGGVLAGAGGANAKNGFLARLDDAGDLDWVRSFTSAGGAVTANALAVVAGVASPLDVLVWPRAVIASNVSAPLELRRALGEGDEFRNGVDGRRPTTIRIGENDTLAQVVTAINRAIGVAGRAEIVRGDGVERLSIKAHDGSAVRIDVGRDGRDALQGLGLTQGIISKTSTGSGALKTYGLGLIAADLKLDSKENLSRTKAELSAAISIIRQAYDRLLNPNAKPLTDDEKALEARRQAGGVVPEYYTAQLANYRAALARLTGG